MAYRRFSLPSLKLTQRPVLGEKSIHFIKQGSNSLFQGNKVQGNSGSDCTVDEESSRSLQMTDSEGMGDVIEVTSHELESKANAAGWAGVRRGMLTAVTEAAAMPLSQGCLNCDLSALFRCQQCGPLGFFCEECFLKCHSSVNIFHVPEKWEVIGSTKKGLSLFKMSIFSGQPLCTSSTS